MELWGWLLLAIAAILLAAVAYFERKRAAELAKHEAGHIIEDAGNLLDKEAHKVKAYGEKLEGKR